MNEKNIVDARGELCPKPLIMTKKVLTAVAPGEHLTILIDNETSMQNVTRFLKDNHASVTQTLENGLYTLFATKGESPTLTAPEAEEYCTVPSGKSHAICIKNQYMGDGDPELGKILLKAFINTISSTSSLPQAIIFYNSGVYLTTETSPVIDTLKGLEKKGITILVCGTCVDFYDIKDQVKVGIISNMYDISEALVKASSVVYP